MQVQASPKTVWKMYATEWVASAVVNTIAVVFIWQFIAFFLPQNTIISATSLSELCTLPLLARYCGKTMLSVKQYLREMGTPPISPSTYYCNIAGHQQYEKERQWR